MKYIIILLVAIGIGTAQAQDSSQFLIRLQFKQKFAADLWPQSPSDKDYFFLDTLRKVILPAGDHPDSVTTVVFKAGSVLAMAQKICTSPVASYYKEAEEFFIAPLVVNGYSGILNACLYYISVPANPYRPAALWLYPRLISLIDSQKLPITTNRSQNIIKARTPTQFN